MEIAVAQVLGKNTYILNNLGQQSCKEETEALATLILNGKISLTKNINKRN